MKKGKRRQIAVLIVLCLFLLRPESVESSKSVQTQTGEVTELTWFCDFPLWEPEEWSGEPDSGTGAITEATGVKIEYQIPEENGDSRLSLMLINGKVPDIISVEDSRMIHHLIAAGEVWNMQELLETFLPQSHLLTDYPQDIKNALISRDGGWFGLVGNLHSPDNQRLYGMPENFYRQLQRSGNDIGIIWNRALLKRLGLSVGGPRTEEEVLQAFRLVREREVTVNGIQVTPLLVDGARYQDTTLEALYDFFGAYWLEEDGSYKERIRTEGGKHALQFLNGALRQGYITPEQFMLKPYNVGRLLNSGQVLCFIGDIRHSGIDPEEWVSSGAILSGDGSKPVLGRSEDISRETMTTFVSKSCEYPEAAAKWLDYMTSPEGMGIYSEGGVESWWPLLNEDWYYATRQEPDRETQAWAHLLCAFARLPETVVYDRARLDFPLAQEDIRELETAAADCISGHLNRVLMAETPETFEAEYDGLNQALEEAGIKELEAFRKIYFMNPN